LWGTRIIRVRYERGILKPLDPVELQEGEELRIQLLPEEFPDIVDKVSENARDDVDRLLNQGRERWRKLY